MRSTGAGTDERREGGDPDPRRPQRVPRWIAEAFPLFVEGVRDYAIFMLDPDGRVASWNLGAERIKGWRADEIIGRHFSTFYPPDDVARGKPARALEVATREGRFEDEDWRVRKDGTRFWANVVISAVRSPSGELLGFGKVTRDLTQRKRSEEERLALAARDLALRAREDLLLVTAHELRTPIAALQLQADLVRREVERVPEAAGERLSERVARLQHSAARLSRLVDAVLRVATLDRDEVPLERQQLDLRQLVAHVVAEHRADIVRAGSAVELGAGDPVPVAGDGALLEVLVGNLLANALKYGARQPVWIGVERVDGRARITVVDHGIGIAPEGVNALFHRFGRAVSARNYGGLGLGLWTVRAIAEAHGGSVRVSSEAGRGSTFEVEIAAGPDAGEQPSAAP